MQEAWIIGIWNVNWRKWATPDHCLLIDRLMENKMLVDWNINHRMKVCIIGLLGDQQWIFNRNWSRNLVRLNSILFTILTSIWKIWPIFSAVFSNILNSIFHKKFNLSRRLPEISNYKAIKSIQLNKHLISTL